MRFKALLILTLFLASTFLFADCDITYVKTLGLADGSDRLQVVTVNGIDYLFIRESTLVEFFNLSNPSAPMKNGGTDDLTGTCGAVLNPCLAMGVAAEDTAVFVTRYCGDILCYNLSNMPNAQNCATIPGASSSLLRVYRSGSKRYLITGGNGIKYADYSSLGSASDTRSLNSWIDGVFSKNIRISGDQMLVAASTDLRLYNIGGMPGYSLTKQCTNVNPIDALYDPAGYFYVVDSDGTFKVLAYSNCAELASLDIGGSSIARLAMRDNLVFVALGQYISSTGKGGFHILDLSNPNNPVDVSGNASDFYGNDLSIIPHPVSDYFYLSSASTSVYSFNNCTAVSGPLVAVSGSPAVGDDHPSGGPSCATTPSQGPFACDGQIDSGEEFDLTINLKNTGTDAATSVSGTLTYTDGDGLVTVNQPNGSYGTIISGGTAFQSAPYHLTVDPNANTTSLPISKNFNLHVTETGGAFWDIPVTLTIQGSRAVLVRTATWDGSAQTVTVSYENQGTADSNAFDLSLETSTKGIDFGTNSWHVPSLAANGGLAGPHIFSYTEDSPCSPLDYISLHFVTSPKGADGADEYAAVPSTYSNPTPYLVEESDSSYTHSKISSTTTDATFNVFFTLANHLDQATNVQATLTVDRTDIITIGDNTAAYGTIAGGGTKANPASDPFTITVDSNGTGAVIFTLDITSNEGCWQAIFAEPTIEEWQQDLNISYVDWRAVGCGTHPINPPDHPDLYENNCYTFYFKIQNDGSSAATDLPATLASDNAEATVSTTEDYYDIGADGDQAENRGGFSVQLSDTYCDSNDNCPALHLTLSIPDANGFTQIVPLTILPSGGTTTQDPLCQYKSGSLAITSDGNSNGQANPGETVGFSIAIENVGDADATGVSATISAPSSHADWVTINTSTVSFGTIAAGGYATGTSSYQVTFSSDITGNTSFTFPLSITANGGYQWNGSIKVTVTDPSSAPDIQYVGYSFCDDTYGNADGVWNPGEQIPLTVTLHNDGTQAAMNASVTLTANTSGINPASSTVTVSRILAAGSADAIFTISMESGVTATAISFTVSAASYNFSADFTVNTAQDNNADCGGGGGGAPSANFTWTPSSPNTGETVQFNDQSSGGPSSWAWNFGDGSTSTAQNPTHAYGAAGTYQVTLTVSNENGSNAMTKGITVKGGGGQTSDNVFILPVVTRAHGNYDSYWKTDLFLYNPNSAGNITFSFIFTYIYNGEGNSVEGSYTLTLQPFQTIIIQDVLSSQFPTLPLPDDISGTLKILFSGAVSSPPLVEGRIYNETDVGTFGQFIPAVSLVNPAREYTDDATLYALQQNADFRSQVGITNLSSLPNTLSLTILSRTGEVITQFNRDVGGYANDQFSLYSYVQEDGPFTIKIHSESKLPFTSYASISDKITSDAIFQSDVKDTGDSLYLHGVTHAAGAHNSTWRTDLYLYNPSSAQMAVTAFLYENSLTSPAGFLATKTYNLLAGETLVIQDIVADIMPSVGDAFSGTLIFNKSLGAEGVSPYVSSRTYNVIDGGGTFGQFIPGLSQNTIFSSGDVLYMTGLREGEAWRTNIGFFNTTVDAPLVLNLTLYDPQGNVVATKNGYGVDPLSSRQVKLTDLFGDISLIAGTIKIDVVSGSGGYIYASVVDNGASDAIFIPAQKETQINQ